MSKTVYLDNSATTSLCLEAVQAMADAAECFANPSSLHIPGMTARRLIESARADVSVAAGLRRNEGWHVVFTGSGTEASNLAISGAVFAKERFESRRIIITDSEHPSVANTVRALGRYGFETIQIPTVHGSVDLDSLGKELVKGAFLVSVMLVNNETGALYDIPSVSEMTRRICPGALIHVDAVQGFLRLPLPLKYSDMITVSAHKIHGPKGVGALLVSPSVIKRRSITAVINGGGQEEGLRSGTENVSGIVGFGAAAKAGALRMNQDTAKLEMLYAYAVNMMEKSGVRINVPDTHVPHIISATLPGIKSHTMLSFLSERGICVSSGSACSSSTGRISSVLTDFGLDEKAADSTIRVSLCADNTRDDIDELCLGLKEGIARLIRIK